MRQFEWNGNHAALDFVNTLDERFSEEPVERLPNYGALLEFMHQADLLDDETVNALQNYDDSAAENVWLSAIQLRETLFSLLEALKNNSQAESSLLKELNTRVQDASLARKLAAGDSGLRWVWQKWDAVERPLWELALSAQNLLVSDDAGRIKQCAADDCGVFFVDTSRAGTRRWCSMANCGNRNKVRRFRSEH